MLGLWHAGASAGELGVHERENLASAVGLDLVRCGLGGPLRTLTTLLLQVASRNASRQPSGSVGQGQGRARAQGGSSAKGGTRAPTARRVCQRAEVTTRRAGLVQQYAAALSPSRYSDVAYGEEMNAPSDSRDQI